MLVGVQVMELRVAFVFYVVIAVIGTIGFYLLTASKMDRQKRSNIWWLFAGVICFTMPAWGIVVIVAIYALQSAAGKMPPPVVSDEIAVQDAIVFAKPIRRLRQIEILERLDIEPFMDIFRTGRSALKKSAIKFLCSIKSKEAIAALHRALLDKDIEVRLYAAGVINMIEDQFLMNIESVHSVQIQNPADMVKAMELANLYQFYADSGLLESIASSYYFEESIKILERFAIDPQASFMLARSHFELKQYDIALSRINSSLEAQPNNEEYHRMKCEILFSLRLFEDIYSETKVVESRSEKGFEEALAYWK